VQIHEKYFDGWLSLQPGAHSNGRLLSCIATSPKSKLERKTGYCKTWWYQISDMVYSSAKIRCWNWLV